MSACTRALDLSVRCNSKTKSVLVLRDGDMPIGFCTVRIGSYTEEFAQGSEIYYILEKMALGLK